MWYYSQWHSPLAQLEALSAMTRKCASMTAKSHVKREVWNQSLTKSWSMTFSAISRSFIEVEFDPKMAIHGLSPWIPSPHFWNPSTLQQLLYLLWVYICSSRTTYQLWVIEDGMLCSFVLEILKHKWWESQGTIMIASHSWSTMTVWPWRVLAFLYITCFIFIFTLIISVSCYIVHNSNYLTSTMMHPSLHWGSGLQDSCDIRCCGQTVMCFL